MNATIYYHKFIIGANLELHDGSKCKVIGTITSQEKDYDILTEFEWYALGEKFNERYYPRWCHIDKINGVNRDDWEKQQIGLREKIPVNKLVKNGKGWSVNEHFIS